MYNSFVSFYSYYFCNYLLTLLNLKHNSYYSMMAVAPYSFDTPHWRGGRVQIFTNYLTVVSTVENKFLLQDKIFTFPYY